MIDLRRATAAHTAAKIAADALVELRCEVAGRDADPGMVEILIASARRSLTDALRELDSVERQEKRPMTIGPIDIKAAISAIARAGAGL